MRRELAKDADDSREDVSRDIVDGYSRRMTVQSLRKSGRWMRDSMEPVAAVLMRRSIVSENTRRTRRDESEEVNEAAEVN